MIAANAALSALSKNVSAEELVNHIEFIRNLIASMVSDARRRKGGVGDGEFLLPGFNMPKGKCSAFINTIFYHLSQYSYRSFLLSRSGTILANLSARNPVWRCISP